MITIGNTAGAYTQEIRDLTDYSSAMSSFESHLANVRSDIESLPVRAESSITSEIR
jgi:hypothetical protein